MRNSRILKGLSFGITFLIIMASETVYAQVTRNSSIRGIQVGASRASRGSSMMSSFNHFSTGSERITVPVTRTSRDPLSVRLTANLQSPLSGLAGGGGTRASSRPNASNFLRPTRPSELNQLMSFRPNMLSLGTQPRSRISAVDRKTVPLRPIRGKSNLFTIKPRDLLQLDVQQQKTRVKYGGLLSLAQSKTVTQQTMLTQDWLTAQNKLLSQNHTIFDIGLQLQNERQAPKSIFYVR